MKQYVKPSIEVIDIEMENFICGSQGDSSDKYSDGQIGFGNPAYPDD